jgi:transcriptional regulator with XRE-family HTH domain
LTVKLHLTILELKVKNTNGKGDNMPLLDRIKKARIDRGLTLEKFGELIGRSRQYMSQLERGKIRLSYETASKIARALATTPDELFFE